MANRHLSRSIVLQTLFQWDFMAVSTEGKFWDKANIKEALHNNINDFAPGLDDDKFVVELLDQVLVKQKVIDEIIAKAAPDWPLDKISVVDRNILRIGLTELLFGDRKEVPPKVAINEAIELAKTFGGENSGKFVNGVLGAVYKELGEPGKDETSKPKKQDKKVNPEDLPRQNLGGALVYAKHDGKIMFALVHDVFGYWTLSKGKLDQDEDIKSGTKREIKEEIGLEVKILEKLGENKYVATHPEHGKTLKVVDYFLAESAYQELVLEDGGGLDEARWFTPEELPGLKIYEDIVPLIAKAIEILSKNGNE